MGSSPTSAMPHLCSLGEIDALCTRLPLLLKQSPQLPALNTQRYRLPVPEEKEPEPLSLGPHPVSTGLPLLAPGGIHFLAFPCVLSHGSWAPITETSAPIIPSLPLTLSPCLPLLRSPVGALVHLIIGDNPPPKNP